MIKSLAGRIIDNPVFYKDVTQWLKSPLFGVIMLTVMIIPEMVAFVACMDSRVFRNSGSVLFYVSFLGVVVCGVWVAVRNFSMTTTEIRNGTQELYEISGMSMERLVGGRLLSIVFQFLFGFFCVIPFLFFAYFLGGVDFMEVVAAPLVMLLFVIPIYELLLVGTLASQLSAIGSMIRFFGFFAIVFLIFGSTMLIVSEEGPFQEASRDMARVLKLLLTADPSTWMASTIFMIHYVLGCLFLFYLACHLACRENDNREMPVKALGTALTLSWLFGRTYWTGGVSNFGLVWFTLIFVVICQQILFNPVNPPQMVVRRIREARFFKRLLYRLFPPGAKGAIWNIFFIYSVVILHCLLSGKTPVRSSTSGAWAFALAVALLIPFYIMVPYVPLVFIKTLRRNKAKLKQAIFTFWVVTFVLNFVTVTQYSYNQKHSWGGTVASLMSGPANSFVVYWAVQSDGDLASFLVIPAAVGGIIGFLLMFGDLRIRDREARREIEKRSREEAGAESSPALPEGAGTGVS